jgi:glycosyltransferase involved in cell wall biosynthesis
MISVIITAYEAQEYLWECLQSVMEQDTSKQYEVLLGIDACQKSLAAFWEWKDFTGDKKVKAFMMEENVGTYVTSNTLVTLSNPLYPYALRFDSDDVMMPSMLGDALKMAGENTIMQFPAMEKNKLTKVTHGCIGFHKEVFAKLDGYKEWRCAADSDFIIRAKKSGVKTTMNKRPSFYRRVHDKSLTKSPETGMGSKLRRIYKKSLGHPKTTPIITFPYSEIRGTDTIL